MRYIQTIVFAAMLAFCGNSLADGAVYSGPQLGLYMTKHFGSGSQAAPVEYGMQLNYRSTNSFFDAESSYNERPALFDLRFAGSRLQDFRASGVSMLEPTYMLRADGEGFFGSINWLLVGFAAFGVGIIAAADSDSEDRLDRIAQIEKENPFSGEADDGDGSGGSAEEGDGGDAGGEEPTLGCDPALGTGQCL